MPCKTKKQKYRDRKKKKSSKPETNISWGGKWSAKGKSKKKHPKSSAKGNWLGISWYDKKSGGVLL